MNSEPSEPLQTKWSREQIEELLRSERLDYQAVDLPYGLRTGGHDRTDTANRIFPSALHGESVLDVGSSLGRFCFEARRRGAGRVVGIDFDPEAVRKSRILADILGEPVEFKVADVEAQPVGEDFDHVLCLNVLHHVGNPLLALDRLVAATRRRLVLEVATLGRHDRRRLGLNWVSQWVASRIPALMVASGTAAEGVTQFYFTPTAIENLLRYRRGCFARIDIEPSGFKQRFLVIAHKRRIGHLLALAGPTSAGAAALLQRIEAGEVAGLEGIAHPTSGSWGKPMLAAEYHKPQEPDRDRLAFLYDFDRPLITGAAAFGHDPALEVLDTARQLTVLTVGMPHRDLLMRLDRMVSSASGRTRKRLTRLRNHYADPQRLLEQYRAWFRYIADKQADHRIIQVSGERATVTPTDEWERVFAASL